MASVKDFKYLYAACSDVFEKANFGFGKFQFVARDSKMYLICKFKDRTMVGNLGRTNIENGSYWVTKEDLDIANSSIKSSNTIATYEIHGGFVKVELLPSKKIKLSKKKEAELLSGVTVVPSLIRLIPVTKCSEGEDFQLPLEPEGSIKVETDLFLSFLNGLSATKAIMTYPYSQNMQASISNGMLELINTNLLTIKRYYQLDPGNKQDVAIPVTQTSFIKIKNVLKKFLDTSIKFSISNEMVMIKGNHFIYTIDKVADAKFLPLNRIVKQLLKLQKKTIAVVTVSAVDDFKKKCVDMSIVDKRVKRIKKEIKLTEQPDEDIEIDAGIFDLPSNKYGTEPYLIEKALVKLVVKPSNEIGFMLVSKTEYKKKALFESFPELFEAQLYPMDLISNIFKSMDAPFQLIKTKNGILCAVRGDGVSSVYESYAFPNIASSRKGERK